MQVKDIVDILKCQILVEGDLEQEVKTACGSDMMSDVLAFVKDQSVLLTGLMHRFRPGQAREPAGAGPCRDEGHDGFKLALPYVHRLRAAV